MEGALSRGHFNLKGQGRYFHAHGGVKGDHDHRQDSGREGCQHRHRIRRRRFRRGRRPDGQDFRCANGHPNDPATSRRRRDLLLRTRRATRIKSSHDPYRRGEYLYPSQSTRASNSKANSGKDPDVVELSTTLPLKGNVRCLHRPITSVVPCSVFCGRANGRSASRQVGRVRMVHPVLVGVTNRGVLCGVGSQLRSGDYYYHAGASRGASSRCRVLLFCVLIPPWRRPVRGLGVRG